MPDGSGLGLDGDGDGDGDGGRDVVGVDGVVGVGEPSSLGVTSGEGELPTFRIPSSNPPNATAATTAAAATHATTAPRRTLAPAAEPETNLAHQP